ncbi:MAG: flavodoxin family protein [Patescibacteria group bacterium]
MKFLIINGSPRKRGNTDKIISVLKRVIEEKNLKAEEIILRDIEMKLCDGCENCANSLPCPNIKDEFSKKYLPKISNYDIYLLATPTYCDNVTPLMKNFIDRILPISYSKKMGLKNKKIGIIIHGMSGMESFKFPIMWIKSVCGWTKAKFVGYLTFKSGAKAGDVKINNKKINLFLNKFLK